MTFKPGIAGGMTVQAADWLGLKPGPNTVEMRLTGFRSYTNNSYFTHDNRTVTVIVQGSCEPRPDISVAPAPIARGVRPRPPHR